MEQTSRKKIKEDKNLRMMGLTVKAVLLNSRNQVLVLRRATGENSNAGLWDLPGGGVEKGETLEEALKREIKEETGLDSKLGPLVKVSEFPRDHIAFESEKRGLRFIAYVLGDDDQVKIDQREHIEFRWLDLDQAIELFPAEGFEGEKRETLLVAKKQLEMTRALENWKRSLADLENYKKRTEKNNLEFRKYCLEDLMISLIPVLDNFDLSLEHVPETDKDNNWTVGILHIRKQLFDALAKFGLELVEVKVGDQFSELTCEAVSGNGGKNCKIKKILKKGYRLGGKVIRPAMVEIE